MADPLEQLSDPDLQALANNHLEGMSDEGLKIVAASGKSTPAESPQGEPLLHKVIRQGLPMAGQVAGGLGAAALATPETAGIGAIPAAMAGAGAGQAAGAEAAGWLNHAIYNDDAPTYDSLDDAKRVGTNVGIGAASELVGQGAGKALSAAAEAPLIKPALEAVGEKIAGAGDFIAPKVAQEVAERPQDWFFKPPLAKTAAEPVGRVFNPAISKLIPKLVDLGTVAAGYKLGGAEGAAVAYVARPMVQKTAASTANVIANVLEKTPSFFGKYAPALANAAARGELSLNASVYVLQQRDPEFRQKMEELNNSASAGE